MYKLHAKQSKKPLSMAKSEIINPSLNRNVSKNTLSLSGADNYNTTETNSE